MRTRSGKEYTSRKVQRSTSKAPTQANFDLFESLPNSIILTILALVASVATSPADLLAILSTCKRIKELGLQPFVLSKASLQTFVVKARNWSESANRFFQRCSDAGNLEACYTLGMIRFYCMHDWISGECLLAKAARNHHVEALYSLAIIQFNGSGSSDVRRNLPSGVDLCSQAASLGHIDAMRELGYCYIDGTYGVTQDVRRGRSLVRQSTMRQVGSLLLKYPWALPYMINDIEWNQIPPEDRHPANRFLCDWFSHRKDIVICSYVGCGRAETRLEEFRQCISCFSRKYCSQACQALHLKSGHMMECLLLMAQVRALLIDERSIGRPDMPRCNGSHCMRVWK